MLHRSCVGSLALVALVAGTQIAGTQFAGHARGADRPSRPIRGNAEGVVTGVVLPNELIIQAAGNSSHLGKFTREEHLFLNPDGFSFQGTIVFTAANGDLLKASFQGAFTSPTTAQGSYTFTGGTGRFADAAGTANFEATTPDGAHVSVSFAGTISY